MTTDKILEWLEEVKDPEIPVLSLVDLGVITSVEIKSADKVKLKMTPTFVGCPALDVMKNDIRTVLQKHGITDLEIEITYKKPWSSDLMSEKGKDALKRFGLAPPPSGTLFTDINILEHAECPRCNNTDTELRSTFGATLCRSIHYCHSCKESFEQFKPL